MEKMFGIFDIEQVRAYQAFSEMNKVDDSLAHIQDALHIVVPFGREDELANQILEFRERLRAMEDEVLKTNNIGLEEAILLDTLLGKAGLI